MNDVEPYIENSKRIIEIFRKKPWLFPADIPCFNMELYFKYFENRIGSHFFMYPTMIPYTVDILDKYKENIYNTLFLTVVQGSTPNIYTIIQINESLHFFFMWGISPDRKETVLFCTVYTKNPSDFLDFLFSNLQFSYESKKPSGFFGGDQAATIFNKNN